MNPPDFDQLQDDPQLAIVAALDSLLDHVAAALLAAHPEILSDHNSDTPAVWLADIVASESRRLQSFLHRYRSAVEDGQSDHIPRRLSPIE